MGSRAHYIEDKRPGVSGGNAADSFVDCEARATFALHLKCRGSSRRIDVRGLADVRGIIAQRSATTHGHRDRDGADMDTRPEPSGNRQRISGYRRREIWFE